MKKTIRNGAAGLALAAALAAPAFAQTAPDILNEQLQLDDVFGRMDVVLPNGSDGDVVVSGLAYGNVVSVDSPYDGTVESRQGLHGSVEARATITADEDLLGGADAVSTAYGNSGQFITDGGTVSGASNQYADRGETVSAYTAIDIQDAEYVAGTSVATANILATEAHEEGDMDAFVSQGSDADVTAQTDISACCTPTSTTGSATAMANSYDSTASGNSRNIHEVYQSSQADDVAARTYVTQAGGEDITAVSSASANSILVDSAFGYTELTAAQDNSATVTAESGLYLDHWNGTAALSAYGVGNSALTYNTGAPTDGYVQQYNTGDVYANAGVSSTGDASGQLVSSSTAIGNAYTSTVCVTCGSNASLGGSVNQNNGGNVYATGSATVGRTGGYYGSAAAIGNSATFTTTGSGGGN